MHPVENKFTNLIQIKKKEKKFRLLMCYLFM